MRVFITHALPLDPVREAPAGVELRVSSYARPMTRDEIAREAADADGLVSMLFDPIDAELIARLPRLKVIANVAVGVNNVDLAAARGRKIAVCNTPGVLTDATADLTMALVLSLARRLREGERLLRSGAFDGWSPSLLLGAELRGRTLGLFGFGRIGRAVAERAKAFGMEIVTHTRTAPALDAVLACDVVSLHAPLTPETRHAIDEKALARMKPTAFLINTARGPLVDEAALVRALESRTIAGAALDVFEDEPRVHPGLLGRDDVVLLPHLGSATRETREAMARLALSGCFAVLTGKTPGNLV